MARIKDVNNTKKRIKPVSLSKRAFLIYNEIKKSNINFNFSNFVSMQLEKLHSNNSIRLQELNKQFDYLCELQEQQWLDTENQKQYIIKQMKELQELLKIDEKEQNLEIFV